MDIWLMILTHGVAFVVAVGASRFWVTRKIQVCEIDGHPALEYRPHNEETPPDAPR